MKVETGHETRAAHLIPPHDVARDRYLQNRACAERLRKGQDIRLIEGVQRVCPPILALYRAMDIDDTHLAAAERWYRDYVLGVEGARDPDLLSSGKAPDVHASMLSRVAACERYRSVRDALGLCGEVRLHLLLIRELTFSSMASLLLPADQNGRKKIAAQVVLLLEQLAEYYHTLDTCARRSHPARISRATPATASDRMKR